MPFIFLSSVTRAKLWSIASLEEVRNSLFLSRRISPEEIVLMPNRASSNSLLPAPTKP